MNTKEASCESVPVVVGNLSFTTDINTASKIENLLKKQKLKQLEEKPYASMLTSLVHTHIKNNNSKLRLDRINNTVYSQISVKGIELRNIKQINEDDCIFTTDEEILERFNDLRLGRKQRQVLAGIINIYIQNAIIGQPYAINIKHFHEKILRRKNRIRKEDLEEYDKIFSILSTRRIEINCKKATIQPYNKREIKGISIKDNLINIAVITDYETCNQVLEITPTKYLLWEILNIKQISNCLPNEFLSLKWTENDNIYFFGEYLTTQRQINKKHIIDNINEKAFQVERNLLTIIKESLPNYNKFLQELNNTREKKKFITREILEPLKKALDYHAKHGYLLTEIKINGKTKKVTPYELPQTIDFKSLLKEESLEKVKIHFNYDTHKYC